MNFQHPATIRPSAISLCVASRQARGQLADRIVAFLRERREDPQALLLWRARNRHALRDFWARAPADALGVKKELEKALAQDGVPPK